MLRIAVCEDDIQELENICGMIARSSNSENSILKFSSAENVVDYVEAYGSSSIDIVVSDIELPGINGIQMAEKLTEKCPDMQFIFVSNYTDYIESVFSVNPVYYILKPVKVENLAEAISKAEKQIRQNECECLTITKNKKLIRLRQSEIKYVESDRRTVNVYLFNSLVSFNMKLDELENNLPGNFLRVHKSYLVNMNYISRICNNQIILITGEEIPVAKAKYTEVKGNILEYLRDEL